MRADEIDRAVPALVRGPHGGCSRVSNEARAASGVVSTRCIRQPQLAAVGLPVPDGYSRRRRVPGYLGTPGTRTLWVSIDCLSTFVLPVSRSDTTYYARASMPGPSHLRITASRPASQQPCNLI
jgi:hypothetical protein